MSLSSVENVKAETDNDVFVGVGSVGTTELKYPSLDVDTGLGQVGTAELKYPSLDVDTGLGQVGTADINPYGLGEIGTVESWKLDLNVGVEPDMGTVENWELDLEVGAYDTGTMDEWNLNLYIQDEERDTGLVEDWELDLIVEETLLEENGTVDNWELDLKVADYITGTAGNWELDLEVGAYDVGTADNWDLEMIVSDRDTGTADNWGLELEVTQVYEVGTADNWGLEFEIPQPEQTVVETLEAGDVGHDGAVIRLDVSLAYDNAEIWFRYGQSRELGNKTDVRLIDNRGEYELTLSDLDNDTTYYFEGYAEDENDLYYGGVKSFKTKGSKDIEEHFNFSDLDKRVGDLLDMSAEASGMLLTVLSTLFVILIIVGGASKFRSFTSPQLKYVFVPALIVTLAFTTYLGWTPLYVPILVVVGILIYFGSQFSDMGGE